MTLQLIMKNGLRFAVDADAITAVEENPDTLKDSADNDYHPAIVWAGGHRFVTATAFDAVYEAWLADLEAPEDTGDSDGGAPVDVGSNSGVNTIKTAT